MSQARNESITAETRKQIAELDALGWYHSIELANGTVIKGLQGIERLKGRLAQFPIPADLQGKRVLDIGAWDGWFSFEMERRGAKVLAVDSTRNPKFLLARDLLGSKVEYEVADICRVSPRDLGRFDIVLFLGVLYHLKHPMLGLENVCELTEELACVESYVIDDGTDLNRPPVMEFYEGTELRGQFDNWVGPNTACLLAMARAAGFASVTLESVIEQRAHLTCLRKWQANAGTGPAPFLICAENSTSRDHSFSTTRDDYVSLWFKTDEAGLSCDNLYVEIGPYGARPVNITHTGGDGWLAICKLPPGLRPAWQDARLRVAASQFSNSIRIPVDMSVEERKLAEPAPVSPEIRITLVTDGKTWDRWKVRVGINSCLSVWAEGIPDRCEVRQVSVWLEEANLPAVFLSGIDPDGLKQVNAILPSGLRPGKLKLSLCCEGVMSEAVEVELVE